MFEQAFKNIDDVLWKETACRWVRHKRYPHLTLAGWTPITIFSYTDLTGFGVQLFNAIATKQMINDFIENLRCL